MSDAVYRTAEQKPEKRLSKINWNPWYWFKRYLVFQFTWLFSTIVVVLQNQESILIKYQGSRYHMRFADASKIYFWLEDQPKVGETTIPIFENGNETILVLDSFDTRRLRTRLKTLGKSYEALQDLKNRKF